MTINYNTLFTRIGKALKTAKSLFTSSSTTIPGQVTTFLTLLQTDTPAQQEYVQSGTTDGLSSYQSACTSAIATLATGPVSRLIIQTVKNENAYAGRSQAAALSYLIGAMVLDGESLQQTAVSTYVSYGSAVNSSSGPAIGCVGDGVLVVSTKRGDGKVNAFALTETLTGTVSSVSTAGDATFQFIGEPSVSYFDPSWPAGSGANKSFSSIQASSGSSIVSNGGFEDANSTSADLPAYWVSVVGVPGTNFAITAVAQNVVTINGTPTSGSYSLRYTDPQGIVYETPLLAYNANKSAVQTALRTIPALAAVTVVSSGTSPNWTHNVLMTNVPNPGAFTYVSNLLGGSPTITCTQSVSGVSYVVRGARALKLIGGATNTELQSPVTVTSNQQLAVNVWAAVDVVPAGGVLEVSLVDGIGGTVVSDDQGVQNTYNITLSTLTTHPQAFSGVFRIPTVVPTAPYIRLKLTTPLTVGSNLYLDDLCAVSMTQLYSGGPYAAIFNGPILFQSGDVVSIDVYNTRAGELHELLNRTLNLRSSDLMFPTSSSPSQSDGLLS